MIHPITIFAVAVSLPLAATAVGPRAHAAQKGIYQQASLISASRDRVSVAGDDIRLGDLFTNTGDKADVVIGKTPSPGGQTVFDVYRLAAIAQSHGLVWRARSWSEKVVISRPGQTISDDEIMISLRAAVDREMAAEGRFEVDVGLRDVALTVPTGAAPTVTVEGLRVHRETGQFTANLVAAGAGAPQRVSIAGRLHRVIEVPTLARRLSAGDVIGNEDIQWVTLRSERVGRNVITDLDRLIGMTPTRTLVAGKAVLTGEVQAPRIVNKGSIVIMLLKTPNMVLTSKGRALDHGAKGDVIKVMNIQSKTVIEGEVTASGTVEVSVAAFAPASAPQAATPAATARR